MQIFSFFGKADINQCYAIIIGQFFYLGSL